MVIGEPINDDLFNIHLGIQEDNPLDIVEEIEEE